jgi:hypothetical protein
MKINPKTGTLFERIKGFIDMSMVDHLNPWLFNIESTATTTTKNNTQIKSKYPDYGAL